MNVKILYIEGCNYTDFPVGGQLTFAKQMLKAFGEELVLVGLVTDDFPIGRWSKKEINGCEYNFFALFNAKKTAKKPLVPRRLRVLFALIKYKKRIKEIPVRLVVTRSPEVVIPVSKWGFKNFCYYFAGTGNPLEISRRFYGRMFARFYDRLFFPSLNKMSTILAAADQEHIADTIARSKGILKDGDICLFPTRIDTEVFCNRNKEEIRKRLGLTTDKTIITTTARLHWAKGWRLMLESFQVFLNERPNSILFFIGDGNERPIIESFIEENKLGKNVVLLGFLSHKGISDYINASDLFIMGSIMEGWATSLVEAKACGIPICTTKFSSATSIINDGIDGVVTNNRDPDDFARNMEKALDLKIDQKHLKIEMTKYSLDSLKSDFSKICKI